MRSWKTTTFGAIALIGSTFAQFYPEFERHGLFIAQIGGALGLLFARDNNVSSEQVGIVNQPNKLSEAETKKD